MNTNLDSIARYLEDNHLKLVTAESCTAGMVASTLADVPGCGSWLDCAFVTYSADAKITCLGVKQETIDLYNLTSEEVARDELEQQRTETKQRVRFAAQSGIEIQGMEHEKNGLQH